ncbi:MAG TPA: aminotransferase class V-fold PLP-dependent enzyme [Gammaproteobacteria bacterium]|nr:aminotransferase class V-fold PLP-dependent enzyme [Gammaproteobacteria bacterium]
MAESTDIPSQFPVLENLIYLNHAGVGPLPRRSRDVAARFLDENLNYGALYYPQWLRTEQELKRKLCSLLNAESPDSIALLKNTSEALSVIAHGLDWKAGDNIVFSADEFPSNRIVWESLARCGVEARVVPLNPADPEAALLAAMDRNTRLLSTSSVQYASGLRMDLQRLGEACRKRDILFCIDAIQSLGALPFDAQAVHADFVAADGHKWMLGAEGLAVFYCHPRHLERLRLHQYGWHMVEHAGDFNRSDWQPAANARRFECGSPNMLGIHVLDASLGLLLEYGLENIARNIDRNTRYLIENTKIMQDLTVLSPLAAPRRSGIFTFACPIPPATLYSRLLARNIVCAARGGGIRFSPHFYNSEQQLAEALQTLQDLLAEG